MKGDDLSERFLDFAVRVVLLVDALPASKVGRHIGGQLLRCGTSIGANYEEARGAESRADFVHKLGIAWKEAREASYWLRLTQRAKLLHPDRVANLIQEANEISAIIAKSQLTAKRSAEKANNKPPTG